MAIVQRITILLAVAVRPVTCVSEREPDHKNTMTDLGNTGEVWKQCNITAEDPPSMSMLQHASKFRKPAVVNSSHRKIVVLVAGHSKKVVQNDTFYKMLTAQKRLAAQNLNMTFRHFWSEDVLPPGIEGHYAKVFFVLEALNQEPWAEFALFMDSADAWFHPSIVANSPTEGNSVMLKHERHEASLLIDKILASVPADKHFVLSPVTNLNSGVFMVRNSPKGRKIIEDWAQIAQGENAPSCHPWDQAALQMVFLRNMGLSTYACKAPSCQKEAGGCNEKFMQLLNESGLPYGAAANNEISDFHFLEPGGNEELPRLHCFRCLKPSLSAMSVLHPFHGPAQLNVLGPSESAANSFFPWMINHAGSGYAEELFLKSGMLACNLETKPDLLIAGVSKAGTSSIHEYLGKHPMVDVSPIKEVHFFDREERLGDLWEHVATMMDQALRGEIDFAAAWQAKCQTYFGNWRAEPGHLVIDSTPSYLLNPHAALWARAMFPELKILVSLRDPARRTYSEWAMWNTLARGNTEEVVPGSFDYNVSRTSFEDAVSHWVDKLTPCLESSTARTGEGLLWPCMESFIGEQELTRSFYFRSLIPWMKLFKKSQMQIISFEELTNNPSKQMEMLATMFLALPPDPEGFVGWDEVTKFIYNDNASAADSVGHEKQPDEVQEEANPEAPALKKLCKLLEEENQLLATALGQDFEWCGQRFLYSILGSEKAQEAACQNDSQCSGAMIRNGWFHADGAQLVKSRCPQRPQFYSNWLEAVGGKSNWNLKAYAVEGKGAYVRNAKAANTAISNFLLANFPNSFLCNLKDLDDEILKSRKLFTFVRDPLLMARSGFQEMITSVHEKKGSRPQATLHALSDDMPFLKIDPYKHPQEAFETYLQDFIRLQREGKANVLTSLPGFSHIVPQIIRLHLTGLENHGFLGTVEHIKDDMAQMQEWLGVPDDERVDWWDVIENKASESPLTLKALASTVNFTEAVNRSVAEMLREDLYCLGYQDSISGFADFQTELIDSSVAQSDNSNVLAGSVGILMGCSDAAMIAPGSPGAVSIHLAQAWARKHGYDFFLKSDLGAQPTQSPYEDKLRAVKTYLQKVDTLLWLDLDVFVIDQDRNVEELLSTDPASCKNTGQKHDSELAEADVVFWAATGLFEHLGGATFEHNFTLNLCTGMMAFRNVPKSFQIIDAALEDSRTADDSWPYEEGSIWNALLNSEEMMKSTCVLPETVFLLESLIPEDVANTTAFAIHATTFTKRDSEEVKVQGNIEIAAAACRRMETGPDPCP